MTRHPCARKAADGTPCGDVGGCGPCRAFAGNAAIRARWSEPGRPVAVPPAAVRQATPPPPTARVVPPPPVLLLPCRHEGAVLTECEFGDPQRHLRGCERHGRCTRERAGWAVMTCRRCQAGGLGFEPREGDADGRP